MARRPRQSLMQLAVPTVSTWIIDDRRIGVACMVVGCEVKGWVWMEASDEINVDAEVTIFGGWCAAHVPEHLRKRDTLL